MYKEFFRFTKKPFSLSPDPAFLYLSKRHAMAAMMLDYGLLNLAGFTLITGDIGSGKTTLLRHLLAQKNTEYTIGLINYTHRSLGNLLQWVSSAYSLPLKGKTEVELYDEFVAFAIAEYAAGRRLVLIVDEAQNLSIEQLEELRLLSNINADDDQLLQVVIVGQPQLRVMLKNERLEQFAQRILVDHHILALDAHDVGEYIEHRLRIAGADRMVFDPRTFPIIAASTKGIPRLINNVCETALVCAFAEKHPMVTVDIINDVISDRLASGILPLHRPQAAAISADSV